MVYVHMSNKRHQVSVATHEYHLSNGYEKPHRLHYNNRHKGVIFDNNYLHTLHTDVGLHTTIDQNYFGL